jgi:hypothetical protein
MYGTIINAMDIIRSSRKGKLLNILEKYSIHKIIRDI